MFPKGGEICFGGGFIWVTMDESGDAHDPATNKVIDQYGNYPSRRYPLRLVPSG